MRLLMQETIIGKVMLIVANALPKSSCVNGLMNWNKLVPMFLKNRPPIIMKLINIMVVVNCSLMIIPTV